VTQQLVTAGGAEFYVEVVGPGGPTTVRDNGGAMSLDGVRATIEGIATELAGVWRRVQPSEATVEFGLKVSAKSGKLTGLVVEGGGEATLNITLTWKQGENSAASKVAAAQAVPDAPDVPDGQSAPELQVVPDTAAQPAPGSG
jgi:hypothetical protein